MSTIKNNLSQAESRAGNDAMTTAQEASIGDKVKALRLSKQMTVAALSRVTGLSDRAIRYIEKNERVPGVDAVKKLAVALEVGTDYFMDDDVFEEELHKEEFLAQAKEKYGSRGKAQASRLLQQTAALYAGGELSEEEREAFQAEMEAIFWDSKEEAKRFTPKKYR